MRNKDTLAAAMTNQLMCVDINGEDFVFQFYDSSLGGDCDTDLGYGPTSDDSRYCLMKNSWGASWGEGGYVRICRDIRGEGVCGLTKLSSSSVRNWMQGARCLSRLHVRRIG